MSAPRNRARRLTAILATALGGLAALPAAAQTTGVRLDAQAAVGYATNPFLIVGDDADSGYSEISIQPQLLHRDALGDASLIARYRRTDYFERINSAESYGAEASAKRQLSQLVTGRASLLYDSSILGQSSFGTVGVVDPTAPPAPGTPDITLIGLRERQKSLVAAVGADWRLSTRDSATTDVRASKIDYGGLQVLTSSRSLSATVGYSRALSERTSVGVQGSGSWIDFRRPGYSGSFYQPQLTLNQQLSETMRFSLAAGLLFVTSRTNLGTERTTGFSGSFFGCQEGFRSTFCLRAYSDAQGTGVGDVSRRLGASADYSYRVAENDVLRVAADYSRLKETSDLIQVPTATYFTASASYDHSFSPRLFAGVSAGYRSAAGGGFDRPSDVNVRVFVRTRLGDLQ